MVVFVVIIIVHGWCVDLEGHIFNETQCEPSFVAHKANRGLVHYLIQYHQVMILSLILRALEVVVQVIFKFGLLLI